MKKKAIWSVALFAIGLTLIGAGCSQESVPTTSTPTPPTTDSSTLIEVNEPERTDITLTAEALGEGKVFFEWNIPEGQEGEKYVIVRGPEENPEHDLKHFWFRQTEPRRSVTWLNQPAGTLHYRLCVLEEEKCNTYSNDVLVEVK